MPKPEKKEKLVYVCMSADLIHPGHLNVIREASKLGRVMIGLLTDKAIASYKSIPFLEFNQRKEIAENIQGVCDVVEQDTLDHTENLMRYKPHIVVHGDDWRKGFQKEERQRVIDTLKKWGGKIHEVPYTEGISSTQLYKIMKEIGTTPEIRQKRLKRLIHSKAIVRTIEAHSGLSGHLVEHTSVNVNGEKREFEAIWISSLTDSTAKGKPDIEAVDLTSRLNNVNDLLEVTTKPIIFDGDTGGKIEHFVFTVRTLERLGVSAIIIEDKIGLKKNSLFGTDVVQEQDSIEAFGDKIKAGKHAQVSGDFMIIARIESLILRAGMDDAIQRAKAYIKAGVDGIMIHSREKTPDEIIEFCDIYNSLADRVPLVVVPSSFDTVTEDELAKHGVNIVIYANQLIRSAYPEMKKMADIILKSGSVKPQETDIKKIQDQIKSHNQISFNNNSNNK
ncbi:phosphoenolpyruvate mutase [Saccharicrinis sp. FJH62]|uniref:phosphoenolpyruvate mutase n=1 Tax=Saccharicrinis sp. FJH62 TaxID=3344657 RepID=UPI0035D50C5F